MDDPDVIRDPDMDDVPPELAALDGQRVTVTGRDMLKDRPNRADGTLVVVPGLWGAVRRARECDE